MLKKNAYKLKLTKGSSSFFVRETDCKYLVCNNFVLTICSAHLESLEKYTLHLNEVTYNKRNNA